MLKSNVKYSDIDGYHDLFPSGIRKILGQLRQAIKQAAPLATETISYGMPAFRQNKVLVYYAAYKKHIGFYPTPNPIVYFKNELAKYNSSKGAIQFPIDKPLPLTLIKKIVKFRVKEEELRDKKKSGKNNVIISMADTIAYNKKLSPADKTMCNLLATAINTHLPQAENKIWHGHPVWFLDGNPVAGYDKMKDCVRLMFWSGADFGDDQLKPGSGKFKDASIRYTSANQINLAALKRWLKKAREIQWDYKNITKRKGQLIRLK